MVECSSELKYVKQIIEEEVINYQPDKLDLILPWRKNARLHFKLFNDYESFVDTIIKNHEQMSVNELIKKSRKLHSNFYLALITYNEIQDKTEEWFRFYISFLSALFEWMALSAEASAYYGDIERLARVVANQEYLLCKIQSAIKEYSE